MFGRTAGSTGSSRARPAKRLTKLSSRPNTREGRMIVAVGAAALAEAALADGRSHPTLLGVLASRREQEGRFDEALGFLRRLKDALPGNAAILRAIGFSLVRLDRLEEAVAERGEALAIDPASADALAQRAMAL